MVKGEEGTGGGVIVEVAVVVKTREMEEEEGDVEEGKSHVIAIPNHYDVSFHDIPSAPFVLTPDLLYYTQSQPRSSSRSGT